MIYAKMLQKNLFTLRAFSSTLLNKGKTANTDEVVKLFTHITPKDKEEDIVTIAENLMKMGEARGEQKRNIALAVNFYKLGNSIEVIAKATGLTIQMVRDAIAQAKVKK